MTSAHMRSSHHFFPGDAKLNMGLTGTMTELPDTHVSCRSWFHMQSARIFIGA